MCIDTVWDQLWPIFLYGDKLLCDGHGYYIRMWDAFYGHSAYIQITFVMCRELA